MGRKLYFKALLPVSADITRIWHDIGGYNRVNLGGEDSQYTVYFTGSIDNGLEVLRILLNESEVKIQMDVGY